MAKERLDVILVRLGLAASREKPKKPFWRDMYLWTADRRTRPEPLWRRSVSE